MNKVIAFKRRRQAGGTTVNVVSYEFNGHHDRYRVFFANDGVRVGAVFWSGYHQDDALAIANSVADNYGLRVLCGVEA